MRRFTKVALLLAAISVLACGAAFADPVPKLPMNPFFSPTDVILLSDDVVRTVSSDQFIASGDTGLLTFFTLISDNGASLDIRMSNDKGLFSASEDKTDFAKVLVRTTATTVPIAFDVSFDLLAAPVAYKDKVVFGLADSADAKVVSIDWADDCKINCNNFEFNLVPKELLSRDRKLVVGNMKWLAKDYEHGVQCCPSFRILVSSDVTDSVNPLVRSRDAATLSHDFVYAHLSSTPFIRVRVADENNVTNRGEMDLIASDTVINRDFREADWKNTVFNTRGAVDVPEGKTYNMGVAYTKHGEDTNCEERFCNDCNSCNYYSDRVSVLPYIAVTNLGTESVWVSENFTDKIVYNADNTLKMGGNTSWVCNVWGGLCAFDDTMSGDKAKGWLGGLQEGVDPNDTSHMYDFPCHLYPAYTDTWKAAGNMDINFTGPKVQGSDIVTRINGRLNVAWNGVGVNVSSLCPSCVTKSIWLYWPNHCSEEFYESVMKKSTVPSLDLVFAKSSDVTLEEFNQTAAADEYAAMFALISLDKGLVKSADAIAGTKGNIVLAKLDWTVKAASLSDAGLLVSNLTSDQWWRTEMWNKMAIKLNGMKLDATNVTNVNTNDMTPAELSFLTVVDGPQRNLGVTDTVDVSLYVFVVDSADPAVKYYQTAQGNRFLVVYDGELDGKFSIKGTVVKAAGGDAPVSADFGVVAVKTKLNIAVEDEKVTDINAINADGAEVHWSVSSADIVSLDKTVGLSVKATGLKVGSAVITAVVSGDEAKSADVTITVKSEAPAPVGDSSGGGCNVGFAPAMLLLLAPLGFLKK